MPCLMFLIGTTNHLEKTQSVWVLQGFNWTPWINCCESQCHCHCKGKQQVLQAGEHSVRRVLWLVGSHCRLPGALALYSVCSRWNVKFPFARKPLKLRSGLSIWCWATRKGRASVLCGAGEVSVKVVPGLQGCVLGSVGPTSDRGSQLCHWSTGTMCTKGTAISVGALAAGPATFTYSWKFKSRSCPRQRSSLQQKSIGKSLEFLINKDEAVDQKSFSCAGLL